ncbi:glycosyltransferase family 2 protein [Candidatus Microgenomates bacterium]|nr:glycosyltransferase family 2 protein [Candidatus Microgenomates bacterium]
MSKDPTVSVVIPAFNEEKYIENCLFSLLKSEQRTKINYEVILVDNNSTDKTQERALKFKDGINLRIIHEKKQGRGAARARGFKEARGEIILSADSDTIFYPDWVEILVNGIGGQVVAVTTSCKIVDCSALTNAVFNFIQPKLMVFYRLIFGYYWLSGFSFGILKSVYEKSGGFDPSMQAQEDTDLSFRVARLGKIRFINKPVIFSGRRFKDGLVVGLYDYFRSFSEAFILKKKNVHLDNPR